MKCFRPLLVLPLFFLATAIPTSSFALPTDSCAPRVYQRLVKKEVKLVKKESQVQKKLDTLIAKPCRPGREAQCQRKIAKTKNLLLQTQIKKQQVASLRQECDGSGNSDSGGSPFITSSAGIRVGQANFEIGEAGDYFASVNLPVPAPLSKFLRTQSQYVFAVEDSQAPGGLVYAEPETKAYHHLADGSAPRIVTLTVPLVSTPSSEPVISRSVRIVPASGIIVPSFEVTPFVQSFYDRGTIRINLPGPHAGWSGQAEVRSCELIFNGAYTRRLNCPIKLNPDARAVASALSATVTITFESGSALPRISLLLANSGIMGSFNVPVTSGSLEALLDGQRLPLEVHNIQFPGMSSEHYRHQVVNNEYFFIPALSNEINAIPADAIYPFPDAVIYSSASQQSEAHAAARATRIGIVQSERAADTLPIYTNWTEAALPLAALPIASEFFSPTELSQRAQGIRTNIFVDHTNDRGTAFGLDSVDPTFFSYLAGPNALSMAGGVGLQRINDAITLAANLSQPGLRYVIEGIQAHMFAFYSRWPISVMFDEQGRVMPPSAILSRAGGTSVHTGSEWRLHNSSDFNPNRTRQADPTVQALSAEALTAPYAPVTIGYFEGNEFRSVYHGGPDRQHSIRGWMPAVMSCFMVPSPQCEKMQELIGNAIVTFRIDPRNIDNLGNFYETLKRVAENDAALGLFGTILGRDNTDTMYLNLRLLKTASLDEFLFTKSSGPVTLADRIRLYLGAMTTSVSGRSLFATLNRIDNRDFASEQQAIEITQFSCSYYGLNDCQDPYYALTDSQARALYCREVPDPNDPNRLITVCNWPAPFTTAPSGARLDLLIREGVMRQGYWEATYTLGEVGSLVSIIRDVPELQTTVLPMVNEIREHLQVYNNVCSGTNSPDNCAVDAHGGYGWIGFIGRPLQPFPPSVINQFTGYSDNALYYTLMSAIELTLNFDSNPANGFETFALVFPRVVSYSRDDVFDQWRATTLGIFQQHRFSYGFAGR